MKYDDVDTKLGESDELFRLMVEGVQDYALFMLTPDGHVASWNIGAERIKGYTADEIIDLHFACFYTAEDIARSWPEQLLAKAAADGHVEDRGWRVRKDGSRFLAIVIITAMRDADDQLRGFSKLTRDITASERAVARLHEQAVLFEQVSDAVIATDLTFTITSWNPAAEALYGWAAQEAIGRQMSEVVPTEYLNADRQQILAAFFEHGRWQGEVTQRRRDGTRLLIHGSVSMLKDQSGNRVGAVAINRDITARKAAEQTARRAAERLRVLADLSRAFTEASGDYQALLDLVAQTIAQRLTAASGIALLSDDGRYLYFSALGHYDPVRHQEQRALLVSERIPIDDQRPIALSVSNGQAQFLPVLDITAFEKSLPAHLRAPFARFAPHSMIAVPLRLSERTIGSIALMRSELGLPSFDEDDLKLAQDLAERAALAVHNARLLQQVQAELAERKAAERTLAERERKLSAIFDLLPVGVSILGAEREILYVNPELHSILDVPASGGDLSLLSKRRYLTAAGEPMAATEFASVQAQQRNQAICNVETGIVKEDGQVIWTNVSAVPVDFPDWKLVVVTSDITARKRAEHALEAERALLARRVAERTADLSAANAELARAARLKDEFLANMSHELRTPLNSILGRCEILQEQIYGPLTPKQAEIVQGVEESGRHLLTLINDILDLSKVESDKVELQIEPVGVDLLCRACLRMVAQAALQKRISLTSTVDSLVEFISADERRLKQILLNLLSNAVKFTPEGGKVGLEVRGDREHQMVTFTVWDTGIGIAEADQTRLFKPFVQIDSSLSRQYEGTGLGLALVLRLAQIHGGGVSLDSTPGQGSRFSVTLPWPAAEHHAPPHLGTAATRASLPAIDEALVIVPQAVVSPSAPIRILLAEDNQGTIDLLQDYLRMKGYDVAVARNGGEALMRAEETPPAVILMDIQMPGMDGLEAIRRIRASARLRDIPIVALTALAMPGDRERCLTAGADDYLAKPVNLRTLLAAIEHHRQPRNEHAGGDASSDPHSDRR